MADDEGRMVGEGRQLRDIRLQGGEDSAVCAVCQRSVAITKAGQVRVHGPIGNRCLGSRSLPTVAAVPHPSLAIATSSDVRSPALSSTAGVCSQSLASPLLVSEPTISRKLFSAPPHTLPTLPYRP